MANAQVEKLKALGLRHGEKAVVGLSAALCLLFLVRAALKETIPLTPEQVANDAKAAQANLERRQNPDDILKRLEDEGLKDPGFIKMVEAQQKNALNPDAFKVARAWVTPEPGAGLIRDTPALVAPAELVAYPGRGGAVVYALEGGKRILEDPDAKKDDSSTKARRGRKRRRRSAGGSGGMMGMMGGRGGRGMSGMPGMGGPAPESKTAKAEMERKERELKRSLAGKAGAPKEDEKKKEGDDSGTPEGPWKEITRGLRWVVITGTLDHKTILKNYLTALKNPAVAFPNYKQLEVERQVRQSDGTWSEWQAVDDEKNQEIVFNLPEEEEELTPDDVRIDALVDPLPFLKAGYWEKVHVVSLVPKEKREIPKPAGDAGGMMGGSAGMMGGSAGMMGGSAGMMGGSAGMMGGSAGMMGGSAGMMGGSAGMMGGSAGMMGGGAPGGGDENLNFEKSEADTLMIRSLDFTVEPDSTYRFRLRVVVFNPNYNREDVTPGTNTKDLELKGPWSDPTDEVTMPADVTTYALKKAPAAPNAKRPDLVQFQVSRWNPKDGVTVVRTMEYAPGQIVGEPRSAPIPSSEGKKVQNQTIDFNSHQLLLDETGGAQPINQVGTPGYIEIPAVSLLMRPDGAVVLRTEVSDRVDPVRKDIQDNYDREIKETGKERQSSQGSMYGSMMGGGMMGGGMMGGRR